MPCRDNEQRDIPYTMEWKLYVMSILCVPNVTALAEDIPEIALGTWAIDCFHGIHA